MADDRLEFHRAISAPASEVYRAFTRATPLKDWLCDLAMADARIGGRVYLWWNGGYYVAGEYTALERDQWVAFIWRGKGEPDVTQVEVRITSGEGGTHVSLTHSGLGEGGPWPRIRAECAKGWESSLDNLRSLLETGQDQRYTTRPMLGIMLEDFDPDVAQALRVPVSQGIRLSNTVEGLGAADAGLERDDVIVSLDDKPTGNWSELVTALQGKRAGDIVEVAYYRGAQMHRTSMTLSRRPLPEIPPTPRGLAAAVREINARGIRALEEILKGLPDVRASAKSSPSEWSAMEVMAHLVASERDTQSWLVDMINDDERSTEKEDNSTTVPARLAAIISICPTVDGMVDELKCALAETEVILAELPEKVVAHKGNYWRIGHSLLLNDMHWDEHMNQLETALAQHA